MSKKEMTKATSSEVSTDVIGVDAFGAPPVSAQDIVIPKIMLMQGLSELVTEGKAAFGDFVDSMTGEKLGHVVNKSIEFIPFHMEKKFMISTFDPEKKKYIYARMEAVTAENENLPWEDTVDGVAIKRQLIRNFFVLLPSDMSMPYVVSFKGMSTQAGKQLSTYMYIKNRKAGLVPPAYVMTLGGKIDKNDKGTFGVFGVSVGRKSSNEEIKECLNWYTTIASKPTKVDEPEGRDVGKNDTAGF